ncbi:IPExxxVDY family protein [Mesonia ostreae]|uniref:IPExxxVDY family protein n=1 Tax=Mesonia ostreae TaxID=861110 RepID=A0ABU2KIE8_9FLAO|nr:IPExxxVDY family protein [Mesonia ostreae]MDT0294462.1 IPExxxVDY family protein [Mesonia ostreae]
MANKLMLHTSIEEDFDLIAIHCSLEAYHLAFLLNKNLKFRLQRELLDVDFAYQKGTAYYQLFSYCDDHQQCTYYLIENKHTIKASNLYSEGSLFKSDETYSTQLIPEYKKVDYFLKIENEGLATNTKELIAELQKITSIITAYKVDFDTLKSVENLTFN